MKRNNLIIGMIFICFLLPLVIAVPPLQTSGVENDWKIRSAIPQSIKVNEMFDFHVHVFNTSSGTPIVDASCYLHLYNSTGHHVFEGTDEVASHDWDFAWDIDAGNISSIGELNYIIQCNDSNRGGFFSSSTQVTATGELLTDAEAISFFGVLFSIILLSFLFMYLSHKLIDGKETYPAGLFFLLVGIILSIQTLYMGLIYSRDYLTPAISNPQSILFTGILYSLVGISFISLLFFSIKIIKEIKVRKSANDYGEYYDTDKKKFK